MSVAGARLVESAEEIRRYLDRPPRLPFIGRVGAFGRARPRGGGPALNAAGGFPRRPAAFDSISVRPCESYAGLPDIAKRIERT